MSKEYFWGDALTSTKKEIQWNPSMDDDEDEFGDPDEDAIQHFLFLKQAVLGPQAKDGERNVIEITTEQFDGEEIKQPLFSLKIGLNESIPLDIGVQPPVTFTLISGEGPVYLSGQHMIEINADDEEVEEEDEEEDELEVSASPELQAAKSKKRPLSTSDSAIKKSKMAKLDKDIKKEDEEGEDAHMAEMEDDDEEDDEDFEGEDEDDEESDEDEDDDDEDEEEEEEETPEKPVTKKKGKKAQMNGTSTANVAGKGDGKVKAKGTKKLVKAKGKKKLFSIDEIKQKIQASANVPKKEAKFKNYLQSSFHISEAKKLQDLWGWYRASLPN